MTTANNYVNRYPNPRRRDHSEYVEDAEYGRCSVIRGPLVKMETRGVSFGKNTNSFLYEKDAIINGMPRYDSVVFQVRCPVWIQDSQIMGHVTCELWNSSVEQAIQEFGEFTVGDEVEVLKNEAHIAVVIRKI